MSSMRRSSEALALSKSDEALPPLLLAARYGQISELDAQLGAAHKAQWLGVDELTRQNALHWATRHGQLHAAKRLCAHECARQWLAMGDADANTPLHLAATKSRRLTALFLERGANTNAVNSSGDSPLSIHVLSATKDDPSVTEDLLHHGADANWIVRGESVLHEAIDRGLVNIACQLVRFGARLDTKDGHGRMVFDKVTDKLSQRLFAYIAAPQAWVPDAERRHCMACVKKFNALLARRHHCRHCGRLCCAACARAFVHLNTKPQRVCATCLGVLRGYVSAGGDERPRRASLVYNQLVAAPAR
ncbi:myosin-like protein [Achlya hypogyna]|uniref:Myosin-like protein n=1 Tax=Achlya hypogyna TaxID=1202772 RepID=A0A1V9Z3A4_ACHHY|nr:myosin-like protein [Achlya hypogyna]